MKYPGFSHKIDGNTGMKTGKKGHTSSGRKRKPQVQVNVTKRDSYGCARYEPLMTVDEEEEQTIGTRNF